MSRVLVLSPGESKAEEPTHEQFSVTAIELANDVARLLSNEVFDWRGVPGSAGRATGL